MTTQPAARKAAPHLRRYAHNGEESGAEVAVMRITAMAGESL